MQLQKRKANQYDWLLCALQGSRTPNLLIRSQMLYPIELGALGNQNKSDILFRFGDANIDIFIDLTNIFSLF